MSEDLKNNIRLSKAAKEFNISPTMIVEFLGKKGHKVESSPNTKLTGEMYALLVKEYQGEKEVKKNADQLGDFSYKGKSITVESAKKNEDTTDDFEEEEVTIRFNGSMRDDKQKKAQAEKPVEKKEEKPQEEVKAKVEPKTEAKVETKVEEVVAPKEEAKEVKTAETIVEAPKAAEVKEAAAEPKKEIEVAEKTVVSEPKKEINTNSDKKNNSGIHINVVGKIPLEDKKSKDKKDNRQQSGQRRG